MCAVGCRSVLSGTVVWLSTHQTLIALQILTIQLLIFNDGFIFVLTFSINDSDLLSLEPDPSYLVPLTPKEPSLMVPVSFLFYLLFHMGDPLYISLSAILDYPPFQTHSNIFLPY